MFDLTLTFDNGPEPDVTPHVLDVLAARGIRATFFLIGRKLATQEGRRLAERAAAEGHWIGTHTWSHSVPLGLSGADAAEAEIGRTQEALGGLAHADRFFRPMGQGGHLDGRLLSPAAAKYLQQGGYTLVLWNALPRDWEDPDGWVARAIEQCRARPWSLMVLHDVPGGAMRHLERFLDAAGDMGGRFRQELPPDCMPILRGRVVRPIEPYVALASASA
ncbi:MAG TPA: polysaccharide deacetylase family protein [Afifellaceae bacterium]|nr:polysaccharide deacetylase family protein [Afifellaceae bacterium]